MIERWRWLELVLVLVGVVRFLAVAGAAPSLFREDLGQFSLPAPSSSVDTAARQLLLQGVGAGLPESLYLLAMMKFYGHGEARDVPGAVQLLRRAAEKRHRDAQFALGVLFGSGDGDELQLAGMAPPRG